MNRPELEPLFTPLPNMRRELAAHEIAVGTDVLEAMRLAGYRKPARPNARRLANSPDVRRRVMGISLQAAELAGVHLGRVLIEEARLAFSDMRNYFAVAEDGKLQMTRLDELPREATAAIAKIKLREDGSIEEFVLHDKPGVLKDLRKHVGGGAPKKIELTGKGGAPIEVSDPRSPKELARRVQRMIELFNRAGHAKAATPAQAAESEA